MRAGPSVRGPSLLENYFPYAQAAIEGGRLLGCSNDETVTNETEKAALLSSPPRMPAYIYGGDEFPMAAPADKSRIGHHRAEQGSAVGVTFWQSAIGLYEQEDDPSTWLQDHSSLWLSTQRFDAFSRVGIRSSHRHQSPAANQRDEFRV